MQRALEPLGVEARVITAEQAPTTSSADADLGRSRGPVVHRFVSRAVDRVTAMRPSGLPLGWSVAHAVEALQRRQTPVELIEMEESFGAAFYLQELVAVPVVVRLHGPWFLNGAALGAPTDEAFARRDRQERRCIATAVGLTSPSRDLLLRVRERYGLALAGAAVIPNPAPLVAAERRWQAGGCDGTSILFVGRFDRHKGGDLVIDAFARLTERVPEARLVFVGPDRGLRDEAGHTTSLATYLRTRLSAPAQARVEVRGPLPGADIEALRRQAALTVVASRYENFSLALVEALSFGCPTIASDAGGNPEIVSDDRTGVLFPSGEAEALSAQMQALLCDRARAARLGREAAEDVARRFAPDAVARQTLAHYEEVCAKGVRTPASTGRRLRGLIFRAGLALPF